MESDTHALGGSFFISMLLVLFIGLKLGGVIAWSWWWVMSPLWISWVVGLIITIPLLIYLQRVKGKWNERS